MKSIKTLITLGIITLALAGCAQATSTPVKTVAPALATPVAQVTATPAKNYCLDCHTDKDQLIKTAKPLVAKVVESEGVG